MLWNPNIDRSFIPKKEVKATAQCIFFYLKKILFTNIL
jgi:hypothetical protein